MKETINPKETVVLHPETEQLMHWNSHFQRYFSDDWLTSLTVEEYEKSRNIGQGVRFL